MDVKLYLEPEMLLKDRDDVVDGGSSGDNAGS